MYNRYIPQPDGSFRRNPMQEPRHTNQRPPPPPHPPAPSADRPSAPPPPRHPSPPESVPGFLRQLIPSDFDTGDLIVVLLLLLMSSDCKEDQNTALLTLVLYLLL